jgi:hypothetical protein
VALGDEARPAAGGDSGNSIHNAGRRYGTQEPSGCESEAHNT